MSLDDLNKDTDVDKSTSREYTSIDKQEFEEFLRSTDAEWSINTNARSTEIVYEAPKAIPEWTGVVLRIYSTIDERSGRARSKGEDAIRMLIWDKSTQSPVGGRTKTLRIKTWEKNLRTKIDSLLEMYGEEISVCPECENLLLVKEGQYGKFLGCRGYPSCDYTEKYDS